MSAVACVDRLADKPTEPSNIKPLTCPVVARRRKTAVRQPRPTRTGRRVRRKIVETRRLSRGRQKQRRQDRRTIVGNQRRVFGCIFQHVEQKASAQFTLIATALMVLVAVARSVAASLIAMFDVPTVIPWSTSRKGPNPARTADDFSVSSSYPPTRRTLVVDDQVAAARHIVRLMLPEPPHTCLCFHRRGHRNPSGAGPAIMAEQDCGSLSLSSHALSFQPHRERFVP